MESHRTALLVICECIIYVVTCNASRPFVNGEVVIDPTGLLTMDAAEVVTQSPELSHQLAARAGLLV